ncbi:MAG: iron-sulfur cluster assembly scaffold protein [Pseudomonadota bacterium]
MTAAQTDLMKLYSERILALAAALPHAGRLEAAGGSAKKRSPLCGSTVTVDVTLDGAGRVSEFAQDVKACALGQSSASVLGQTVIGRDRSEIAAGRDALHAMLKSGGDAPTTPFDGLEALLPARDYKNRHASIMLAWDATLDAIDAAR